MNLDRKSGMLGLNPVGSEDPKGSGAYEHNRKVKIVGGILCVVFVVAIILFVMWLK